MVLMRQLWCMLASNERRYPWMDEGINSYYEYRYIQQKYGAQEQLNEVLFQSKAFMKTDQPVATAAADFSESNYYLVAYHKTAMVSRSLYLPLRQRMEATRHWIQSAYSGTACLLSVPVLRKNNPSWAIV